MTMGYRAEIKVNRQTFTIDEDRYGHDGNVAGLDEGPFGLDITYEMLVLMHNAIGEYLKSKTQRECDRVEVVGDFIMRP
jgi:hypothetical protein